MNKKLNKLQLTVWCKVKSATKKVKRRGRGLGVCGGEVSHNLIQEGHI